MLATAMPWVADLGTSALAVSDLAASGFDDASFGDGPWAKPAVMDRRNRAQIEIKQALYAIFIEVFDLDYSPRKALSYNLDPPKDTIHILSGADPRSWKNSRRSTPFFINLHSFLGRLLQEKRSSLCASMSSASQHNPHHGICGPRVPARPEDPLFKEQEQETIGSVPVCD